MHLLAAQKGEINEGTEAVDLGQAPGDVVFLSAADTELAALAAANSALGNSRLQLRLANLMQLAHPMSVDHYAQKTVAGSRLVVARILGGESYWRYGLEKLHVTAVNHGLKLAVLPGDDKPDPDLRKFSTVPDETCRILHAYLSEGGPQNAQHFLAFCARLLGEGDEPPGPVRLLHAGIWHPAEGVCDLDALARHWVKERPAAAICFYRALVQASGLAPIAALCAALDARGVNPLPVFVTSLKDAVSAETVRAVFSKFPPDIVLNATGFAAGAPNAAGEAPRTVLDEQDAVVLQVVLAGGSREAWLASSQGLSSRDLAMNVALPEVDGRVLSRAVAFKQAGAFDASVQASIVSHQPDCNRVNFVADLAANWIKLRKTPPANRRIAIVLANYPNRDGRIANGVGLDTPAGTVRVLQALRGAGYLTGEIPTSGDELVARLQTGPTNSGWRGRVVRETVSLNDYKRFLGSLALQNQIQVAEKWGEPEADPFFDPGTNSFALPALRLGNIVIGVQPARGYNIDPKATYHTPDLVPPHAYLAFYGWLRERFKSHAIVHMGKHGNLEWLPGKALALSQTCWPEAALGPSPQLYPFIVNDPGEGSQAKRRTCAVIVDHLTPPLTRAESHGGLRDLEALVDEYYEASGHDPRRLKLLSKQILDLVHDIGLDQDAGISPADGEAQKLGKLDAYLCDLKEMQIRDGLHVFGVAPEGRMLTDLAVALLRLPRGAAAGSGQSLHRAIARDAFGEGSFDPLDCDMGKPWAGAMPEILKQMSADPWRTQGDTVERIELLAGRLVEVSLDCPAGWQTTAAVLAYANRELIPAIKACGPNEIDGLLAGLDGRFVPPGPSGAPSRGRPDVLPTGRNFYSLDCRAVPTPAAFELGKKSAELLIVRYRQDHGEWPTSFGLSAWGTSNMRTGGDDIAQAMALIGVKPVWEPASRRVTGYEILPLATLGRPRIDVTLRISGFFRDAFPAQIELFDKAVRAVGALEEERADNPIAARMAGERSALLGQGVDEKQATKRAGYRIFGSKPGAYGAGLQALIDEKGWENIGDLAEGYLAWGSYAYGADAEGEAEREGFSRRLKTVEAVIHNQDNREHDLLDSDDYYQFEGGMSAAVEHVSGSRPAIYHNDHSRPERPVIRALEEEIARVVRGRAANPKWIAGVMRHGYKGAFEMAATLDYMFAFAATTGAVRDHHFDLVYDAWLGDEKVREFIAAHNPAALKEVADRFLEAIDRGLWTARSNSAKFELESLRTGKPS